MVQLGFFVFLLYQLIGVCRVWRGEIMLIVRILNNSALIAVNNKREEVVLIGKGISFQRKPGEWIDPSLADKQFTRNSEMTQNLLELFQYIPEEYFEIASAIVRYANKKLEGNLDKSIYLTLFDHINSAVMRWRDGIHLNFGMLEEMHLLYPEEYKVANWALEYINITLDVELPKDESGFIGTHIIQARVNQDIPQINMIMKIVKSVSELVKEKYADQFITEGMHFSRFMTHLKYLSVRYLNHKQIPDNEPISFSVDQTLAARVQSCLEDIEGLMEEKYGDKITEYEKAYLRLHLCQLLKNKQ